MAVSRPLLLAVLGLLLAAATLVAARGASETAADPATPVVAPVTPTPIAPGPAGKGGGKGRDGGAGKQARDKARDPKAGAPQQGEKAERKPPRDPSRRDKRDRGASAGGRTSAPALPKGVPAPVGRALRDRQVVVLFFGQGGADDAATADAVDAVRDLKGVSVFTDSIARLARYRAVVSGLGVAQAPAVVIVGRNREALLVEGFVDAGTLEQLVVDAR